MSWTFDVNLDETEPLDLPLNKEQLPDWFNTCIEEMNQSTSTTSGSGGDCSNKEKELKEALEKISKHDCPTEKKYLQTVANYLLNHLTEEETFITSFQNLKVRFEFVPQLFLNQIENDEDYLPVNFNNCAFGTPDVVLLLVSTDGSKRFKFPILTGDVKVAIKRKDTHYLQLFNYMLTLQRPTEILQEGSRLIGFLMDYDAAYIFHLKVGYWTDATIVPNSNIRIQKCQFDRQSDNFLSECYFFLHHLLATLFEQSINLLKERFEMLTCMRSPTLRFPPLTSAIDQPFEQSYILLLTKKDWDAVFRQRLVSKYSGLEFTESLHKLGESELLVLKTCAALLSGGWTDIDNLRNFLKGCHSFNASSNLYKLIVESLYLGVYSVVFRPFTRFALTRYISGLNCSSDEFKHCWVQDRENMAKNFVDDVFEVAFDAIELGFYHWDIRPANLIWDRNKVKFYVIDWESLVKVESSGYYYKAAKAYGGSLCFQAELSLCMALLIKCILKWDKVALDEEMLLYFLNTLFAKLQIPKAIVNSEPEETHKRKSYLKDLMTQCLKLPPNALETSGEAPKRAPAEPFVSLQLLPLIIVVEGSLVTLKCEFTLPDSVVPAATPDDNVQWSFESSNEMPAETLASTSSSSEADRPLVIRSKLVIEDVQPTLQGIYSCQLRANLAAASGKPTSTVKSTLLLVRSAATATQASSSIRAVSTKRLHDTESEGPSNAAKRATGGSAHKFQHSAGQSSSQWRSQVFCDAFALRLDSGSTPTLELISQSEATAHECARGVGLQDRVDCSAIQKMSSELLTSFYCSDVDGDILATDVPQKLCRKRGLRSNDSQVLYTLATETQYEYECKQHELFYCKICMPHVFPFTCAECGCSRRQTPPSQTSSAGAACASTRSVMTRRRGRVRLGDRSRFAGTAAATTSCVPCATLDAFIDGAIYSYFRTAGQLRHHYLTSHHLCRECNASGEQLPSCMFRAEIDLRAHRLQQHPSGLSRAQLAAERTIFPAELNFNFAASSTANASASSGAAGRHAVQSCD